MGRLEKIVYKVKICVEGAKTLQNKRTGRLRVKNIFHYEKTGLRIHQAGKSKYLRYLGSSAIHVKCIYTAINLSDTFQANIL